MTSTLTFIYSDGGRAEAGFRGDAGDCVTRAITIASELPYQLVYDELAQREAEHGHKKSARNGVCPAVYKPYLTEIGWTWTPTMEIGSGCQVHVRADELPSGRLILRLSGHITTMIEGVVYDTYDPSRGGTRCVYGYWSLI